VDLGDYLSPVFGPLGAEVAFLRRVSASGQVTQVFVTAVDSEGEVQRDLLEAPVSTSLIPSPDGTGLMFLTIPDANLSQQQVQIYNWETGALFTVPPNDGVGQFFSPSWGPNSDRFYVSQLSGLNWNIVEYEVGGTGIGTEIVAEDANETFPVVSPNGSLIAYFTDREGEARLYVRQLSSGVDRKLTDLARVPRKIIWSPDSSRLAFVGGGNIHTIQPDGTDVRQLTTETTGYLLHSWSPNGQSLAYRANLIENPFGVDTYEFYAADVSTGEPEQLLDLAFDVDILWATP
jgi:Tol biopolymer transport system component